MAVTVDKTRQGKAVSVDKAKLMDREFLPVTLTNVQLEVNIFQVLCTVIRYFR